MSLRLSTVLAEGGPPSAAERELLSVLQRELPVRYPILSSVAIYGPGDAAFEADLLILGHYGLYVVDVWAWSGSVSEEKQLWSATLEDGAIQVVMNPVAAALEKARLLESHLAEALGPSCPPVEALVVLPGPEPRIELPSPRRTRVVTVQELLRAVQLGDLPGLPIPAERQPIAKGVAASVVRLLDGLRPRPRPGRGRLRDEAPLAVRDLVADLRSREDEAEEVAACWWMACAFRRALEERGLVEPRMAGKGAIEAEEAFFTAFPGLGYTAYLEYVLRDVAAYPAGDAVLGDLLSRLLRPSPSAGSARRLLSFFRQAGPGGKPRWSFAGDPWTDVFQGLSPALQREYAMIATPRFVDALLLDHTLSPAVEALGVSGIRILDPACGSGLLLLQAFERVWEHLRSSDPDAGAGPVAREALDRIHGTDIRPLAVLVTRIRLVLSYLEKAETRSLAEVAPPPLHVAVADALLAGTTAGAATAPEDILLSSRYQVVVCEPPAVSCKDATRRERYRGLYPSASGRFSLAAPFVERCFQLAADGGFVGLFVPSAIAKRDYGKGLVEQILPRLDVTHVADASLAYIPGHGTPSFLLFGRNRPPRSATVRVVGGKRGEPILPHDPARGEVWSTIAAHMDVPGYEDEYVSVTDVPRSRLAKHPWSFGGGARALVMSVIEHRSPRRLEDLAPVRVAGASSGRDELFVLPSSMAVRLGLEPGVLHTCVSGHSIRDWATRDLLVALTPYLDDGTTPLPADPGANWWRYLWPYQAALEARTLFGSRVQEAWWAWAVLPGRAPAGTIRLLSPAVAAETHFVLDRGDVIARRSVVSIDVSAMGSEDARFALLAYLNSSAVCFWLKQTSFEKGSPGAGSWVGTGMFDFGARIPEIPVPADLLEDGPLRMELSMAARHLDAAARERRSCAPEAVLRRWDRLSREGLLDALGEARMREIAHLRTMVFWQEEIDWRVYEMLGLVVDPPKTPEGSPLPEERPFAWVSDSHPAGLDRRLVEPWTRRREIRRSNTAVQALEDGAYKRTFDAGPTPPAQEAANEGEREGEQEPEDGRPWTSRPRVARGQVFRERIARACEEWLLDRMEDVFRSMQEVCLLTAAELMARLESSAGVQFVRTLLGEETGEWALPGRMEWLLDRDAVSAPAVHRYSRYGSAKRASWEHTWQLQRQGDTVGKASLPVPSMFAPEDYKDAATWEHRGKLDVPMERFVRFPGTAPDGKAAMFGWAGWDRRQRLAALKSVASERWSRDLWSDAELMRFCDAMSELTVDLPSVPDWAQEIDELRLLLAASPADTVSGAERPVSRTNKGPRT